MSSFFASCSASALSVCLVFVMTACDVESSSSSASTSNSPTNAADSGAPATTTSGDDGGGGGGGDGGATAPTNACPNTGRGPNMIALDKFCIDSTPVTAAQYAAFLATNPAPVSKQAVDCGWNDSFAPSTLDTCVARYQPVTAPNRPVVCVDWCDAVAFCKWSGKRLCGRIGSAEIVPEQWAQYGFFDPEKKQYDRACSNNGTTVYSYGDSYDAKACTNVSDVGSNPGCRSKTKPFSDVVDLSGNVYEWVDDCDVLIGRYDNCVQRGASTGSTSESARCDWGTAQARGNSIGTSTGFRCCSD